MRESVTKGPQDMEALCCLLVRCFVVLASATVNTYLDLTYNLQHITYNRELHFLHNIITYNLFLIYLHILHFL